MWIQSLGWEDSLEEEMATHSSVLAWRIPMDIEARRVTIHRVAKIRTRLSNLACMCTRTLEGSLCWETHSGKAGYGLMVEGLRSPCKPQALCEKQWRATEVSGMQERPSVATEGICPRLQGLLG